MTNPNDQAFPQDPASNMNEGLTKREYFAVMAIQGLITGITRFREDAKNIIVNRPKDIAELSCLYADALIAELSKEPK